METKRLILAFVLELGLIGVWLAISISSIVSSLTGLFWFRAGRWKKAHVKMEEIPKVVG